MVPNLASQKVEMLGCIPDTPNTLPAAEAAVNWITPLLVLGTVSIAATGTLLMLRRIKKIKLYQQAREKDPGLSWSVFSRKWKMSEARQIEENERERTAIIEKSLTKRWEHRLD